MNYICDNSRVLSKDVAVLFPLNSIGIIQVLKVWGKFIHKKTTAHFKTPFCGARQSSLGPKGSPASSTNVSELFAGTNCLLFNKNLGMNRAHGWPRARGKASVQCFVGCPFHTPIPYTWLLLNSVDCTLDIPLFNACRYSLKIAKWTSSVPQMQCSGTQSNILKKGADSCSLPSDRLPLPKSLSLQNCRSKPHGLGQGTAPSSGGSPSVPLRVCHRKTASAFY